jgi:CBS domain-containing protein
VRKLCNRSGAGFGLALLSSSALAATQEELLTGITEVMAAVFLVFVLVVALGVYFMKSRDKRRAPLSRIYEKGEQIHAVGPDVLVTECVRKMVAEKIGALVVMDGDRLKGIFTERDALNKVLAAGLAAGSTKVSDVMTSDPTCVTPGTTVADAMRLITTRRFRHLPIVENGRVLAVVSSGDLTRWLVQDQLGEVRDIIGLATRA